MYEVAARGLQTKTATIRVRFVPTRFFMSKPASVNFIYALSTLNGTSVFAAQVVLSLYALKLGASPFAVGLLAATFSLFPMLLAMTAGNLADRYGGRWPMTFGAACGALGLLAPYFFSGMPALYVAAATSGVSVIFFSLAIQNFIGLLSTPDTRARNFSNYTITVSVAMFVGPLIAGFSIDHSDYATTCLYLAMLTLAPIVMLMTHGAGLPGGIPRAAKAGGGLKALLSDAAVRRLLLMGSLVNAGVNLYQFYMPVYAHSIGISASAIGMILATNAAAAFIARILLPQLLERLGDTRLLTYTFYIGAANLLLIPFFHDPLSLALISFMFGMGMGCGQPLVIMLMFSNSKDGRSGEALGLKFATNQLTKLICPILCGAIASAFGLPPMFWVNAVLMALGGVASRSKKNQR